MRSVDGAITGAAAVEPRGRGGGVLLECTRRPRESTTAMPVHATDTSRPTNARPANIERAVDTAARVNDVAGGIESGGQEDRHCFTGERRAQEDRHSVPLLHGRV